jgi:predicted ferric reductase
MRAAQLMRREIMRNAALWSALYLLLVLGPLAAVMVGQTPEGKSLIVEIAIGAGIVGYTMIVVQFATTSRFRWIAPYFGTDAKMQFHRETGMIAVGLVFAHVVLLLIARPRVINFLNPAANLPRAIALNAGLVALALLVALPLGRKALRMSYENWRVTHGALALLIVVVGLVHSLQIGRYVNGPGKQALWIVLAAGAVTLLLDTRLIRPLPPAAQAVARHRGQPPLSRHEQPDAGSRGTMPACRFGAANMRG